MLTEAVWPPVVEAAAAASMIRLDPISATAADVMLNEVVTVT
jgi:hypothetical protein